MGAAAQAGHDVGRCRLRLVRNTTGMSLRSASPLSAASTSYPSSSRHLDVEQDDVGRLVPAVFERGEAVDGFDDAIALVLQAAADHGSDDEGVVGDQDGRGRSQLSCQCDRVGDQNQPAVGCAASRRQAGGPARPGRVRCRRRRCAAGR